MTRNKVYFSLFMSDAIAYECIAIIIPCGLLDNRSLQPHLGTVTHFLVDENRRPAQPRRCIASIDEIPARSIQIPPQPVFFPTRARCESCDSQFSICGAGAQVGEDYDRSKRYRRVPQMGALSSHSHLSYNSTDVQMCSSSSPQTATFETDSEGGYDCMATIKSWIAHE